MDNIRKVIDTNFYGTLKSIYQILPHFRENYGGHIVVVSSFEGKRGLPMDAAYAASKHAITGFMEVFRQELHGTPIHVSTILPGRIDTPMIANIKSPKASPKFPPELVAKAIVKALRSKSKEILVPNMALKLFLVLGSLSPSFADWFTRHYKLQGEDVV
jgi:short-subunit dehydrogenase